MSQFNLTDGSKTFNIVQDEIEFIVDTNAVIIHTEPASINIDSTITGDEGTDANVENIGTEQNAILRFTIPRGDKGETGDAGDEVEMRATSTHIQWKLSDEESWNNVVALSELKGDKGDTGDNVELRKEGDYIQWKLTEEASWTNLIELSDIKGDKGDTGASITSATFVSDDIVFTKDDATTVTLTDAKIDLKGDKGDTGASIVSAGFDEDDIVFTKDDASTVTLEGATTTLKGEKGDKGNKGDQGDALELRATATDIEWKLSEEELWNNLIALSELKGDKGETGDTGDNIELRVYDEKIQWKLTEDANWTDLIALSELKGEKGDTGAKIVSVTFTDDDMVFSLDDTSTVTLTDAKIDLKGDQGDQGDKGINWQGDWSSGSYNEDDAVFHNGNSWIANKNTSDTPTAESDDWDLLAQKGIDGEGAGDMLASTYDPAGGEKQVAFEDDIPTESDFDIKNLSDEDNLKTSWNAKLDNIETESVADLSDVDSLAGIENGQILKWQTDKFIVGDDSDTTYTAGTGVTLSGTEFSSNDSEIDHNSLNNYSSDEHFTQGDIVTLGTVISGNVDVIIDNIEPTKITFPIQGSGDGYVSRLKFLGSDNLGFHSNYDGTQYRVMMRTHGNNDLFMVDNSNAYYYLLSFAPTYVGTIRGDSSNGWGNIGRYYRPNNTGNWRLEKLANGDEFEVVDWNDFKVNKKLTLTSGTYRDHLHMIRHNQHFLITPSTGDNSGVSNEVRFEGLDNINAYWFDKRISTAEGYYIGSTRKDEDWDNKADGTNAMGVVVHGSTAGTARPTGYGQMTWIGSVEPTNATDNDIWIDTS